MPDIDVAGYLTAREMTRFGEVVRLPVTSIVAGTQRRIVLRIPHEDMEVSVGRNTLAEDVFCAAAEKIREYNPVALGAKVGMELVRDIAAGSIVVVFSVALVSDDDLAAIPASEELLGAVESAVVALCEKDRTWRLTPEGAQRLADAAGLKINPGAPTGPRQQVETRVKYGAVAIALEAGDSVLDLVLPLLAEKIKEFGPDELGTRATLEVERDLCTGEFVFVASCVALYDGEVCTTNHVTGVNEDGTPSSSYSSMVRRRRERDEADKKPTKTLADKVTAAYKAAGTPMMILTKSPESVLVAELPGTSTAAVDQLAEEGIVVTSSQDFLACRVVSFIDLEADMERTIDKLKAMESDMLTTIDDARKAYDRALGKANNRLAEVRLGVQAAQSGLAAYRSVVHEGKQ